MGKVAPVGKKCAITGKKAVGRKAPKFEPSCYSVKTVKEGANGRKYKVMASKRWTPVDKKKASGGKRKVKKVSSPKRKGAKGKYVRKRKGKKVKAGVTKKKTRKVKKVKSPKPKSASPKKPKSASPKARDPNAKQYKNRKAPLDSATQYAKGHKMTGLDGNMYEVITVKKGAGTTKRWRLVK